MATIVLTLTLALILTAALFIEGTRGPQVLQSVYTCPVRIITDVLGKEVLIWIWPNQIQVRTDKLSVQKFYLYDKTFREIGNVVYDGNGCSLRFRHPGPSGDFAVWVHGQNGESRFVNVQLDKSWHVRVTTL